MRNYIYFNIFSIYTSFTIDRSHYVKRAKCFLPPQSSKFHKHHVLYASQLHAFPLESSRTYARTCTLVQSRVIIPLTYCRLRGCWYERWNGMVWPRRAKSEPSGRGSVQFAGLGFRFGFSSSLPYVPTLPRVPHHHRFAVAATIPHTRRGGGVRREGWSWINTRAGRGGAWTTMARAYAASSRGGFKDKDSLRQFIPATLSTTLLIFFFLDYMINIVIKLLF